MSGYAALAAVYDRLTGDVDYDRRAERLLALFARHRRRPDTLLDLACGTGSLALRFAAQGIEVIGTDGSADMLTVARERAAAAGRDILFLEQDMPELDLYGTVDACVCSLDAVNYLTDPAALREALRRVALFMNPGGVFLFDALTPAQLPLVADASYIRECDEAVCVHSESCEGDLIRHRVDLFLRAADGRYDRVAETHRERVYAPDALCAMLRDAGFSRAEVFSPGSYEPLPPDAPRAAYIAYK